MLRTLTSNRLHFLAMAALALLVVPPRAIAAGPAVWNGWFRTLPAGLPAAGYFELHNGGSRTIDLTGASSPSCGMLMLHRTVNTGGMSRMVDVPSIRVAPGDTVQFAPGGYHLMCMDPRAMRPGSRVPVQLHFADGSSLQTEFIVRDASGR